MASFALSALLCLIGISVQVFGNQNDHEPMVAFICGKPAMHRGVNGWISDPNTEECWDDKRPILNYCKQMYPSHNITNVVEAAYLVTIPGWPSLTGQALHSHRVRPFRCIVDNFQSDALLVPQHCKFDHKHNEKVCQGFSHWEVEARDACAKDGMHCESFGMLLNCGLGTFSGVEYVCCPNQTPTHVHPTPEASVEDSSESEDQDELEEDTTDADVDAWESAEVGDIDGTNLYEQYLRGQPMPAALDNEHKRFTAARQHMHKLQEAKNTQLMKEWTAARDHVNEVRKTDPKTAEKLSKQITERFQRLYNAYEQEDIAEKQQIIALHEQKVQKTLNQRKRHTMDRYIHYLEKGDAAKVERYLRAYIKAEEKDSEHTVNHYTHVKNTLPKEAERIHPHVIQHLKLCQQRMEQALEMLDRYPDLKDVKASMEEYMKTYEDLASRIRRVVLPDPETSNIQSESDHTSEDVDDSAQDLPRRIENIVNNMEDNSDDSSDSEDSIARDNESQDYSDDSSEENEHDYLKPVPAHAHAQMHRQTAQQSLQAHSMASSVQLGTTFGIAIGSVAVFVVLVVAVVMLRRRSTSRLNVTHGYVEVDPAASPEERHVANMQMNGYENPTYRYFEVQTTK